jgi:uncharacterized protein YbgA (DUF1722 family)/uncharacterized protein YbbK (DUF523 family)
MIVTDNDTLPIRIGISACLLGQKVRFDGGHKHDRYLTDILGAYISFVPVCPEEEVGMGTPREAVRLVGSPENPQMVGGKTGADWTARMNTYSARRTRELASEKFSGFILKKDSPSCGMERVRLYANGGSPARIGRGLFADALIKRFPLLPVEEEGRLRDDRIRENFVECVFAYHRLQVLMDGRFSLNGLVRFHTAHKYLLMAHSVQHYRQLGRLVATAKQYTPAALREEYCSRFMEALRVKTTPRKHVNVLHHIMGFLKRDLAPEDKKDILAVIEDYRNALVPLIVPMTLINHYLKKHDVRYIRDQVYLNPHPKELMLRNHI